MVLLVLQHYVKSVLLNEVDELILRIIAEANLARGEILWAKSLLE